MKSNFKNKIYTHYTYTDQYSHTN